MNVNPEFDSLDDCRARVMHFIAVHGGLKRSTIQEFSQQPWYAAFRAHCDRMGIRVEDDAQRWWLLSRNLALPPACKACGGDVRWVAAKYSFTTFCSKRCLYSKEAATTRRPHTSFVVEGTPPEISRDEVLSEITQARTKAGIVSLRRLSDSAKSAILRATSTLVSDNPEERVFWFEAGLSDYPRCRNCNNSLTVFRPKRGTVDERYGRFCSHLCAMSSEETKAARETQVRARYGVSNVSQAPPVIAQRNQTFDARYGGNPSVSEEVKQKRRKSIIDRFGTTAVMQNAEVRAKFTETSMRRYGVPHPQQAPEVIAKRNATNFSRYGNASSLHGPEQTAMKHKTWLQNLGTANPLAAPSVREKIRNTLIARYGVEHSSQMVGFRDKLNAGRRLGWLPGRLSRIAAIAVPMFSIEEYVDVARDYPWRCVPCGKQFEDHIDNGSVPRCPFCHPISEPEDQFAAMLVALGVEVLRKDRTTLGGRELDFLLPGHGLAFEMNGLYWHSEQKGKGASYHLRKTVECERLGIRLVHVFEDEWVFKQDIVRSRVANLLGYTPRVHARQLVLDPVVVASEANQFLDATHIQGRDLAPVRIALRDADGIVALMTFRASRFDPNSEWELSRFSVRLGTRVVGAASRLFTAFRRIHDPVSVITYADRRWSVGNLYEQIGFNLLRISNPSYFWIMGRRRESRQAWQKHKLAEKLDVFDPALSESENMKANGFTRIFDCGNLVFMWQKTG